MSDEISMIYKGQKLKEGEASFFNRAMLFGENPFTCLRMVEGQFESLDLHLERLEKSYEFLYDKSFSEVKKLILDDLAILKSEEGIFYFRITFFKSIDTNDIEYFVIKKELDNSNIENEINISFSKSKRVKNSIPNFLKLGNYVDSNIELKFLESQNIHEIIYLNEEGFLTEASKSNVFIVKDNRVMTPKVSYGVLEGITRFNLIQLLKNENIDIIETMISKDEVLKADEIWLTNAIKGLKSVNSIEGKVLNKKLYNKVNEKFSLYLNKRGTHD